MQLVKLLHLQPAQQRVDAELLEPCHGERGGERRQQHVRLREGGEDGGGQRAALFPFHGVVVQVGLQPGADGGLPG